jgi:tripartite-type tricarboxylate transporter receptor subunit TctC
MNRHGLKMVNSMLIAILSLFGMIFSGTAFSGSRDYPNRQIEVVVPFAPGGSSDLSARIFSDGLSKRLGVSIVVSNKAGGSGAAGAEYVVNAKPDGYTLLAPSNTVLITLPLTTPNLSFKWSDFTPITRIGRIPFIIVTNGDSPFNSMADIAAYAKKNPGKLNCGITGAGSANHFNIELWREKVGIEIGIIPYQGGTPALSAQLGGHVDFSMTNLPVVSSLVKAGKLKILVTTAKLKELPQIPTFAEIGFPECNINLWLSIFAPGKIPKEIREKLVMEAEKTLGDPNIIEKLEKIGFSVEITTGKAFTDSIEREMRILNSVAEKVKKGM